MLSDLLSMIWLRPFFKEKKEVSPQKSKGTLVLSIKFFFPEITAFKDLDAVSTDRLYIYAAGTFVPWISSKGYDDNAWDNQRGFRFVRCSVRVESISAGGRPPPPPSSTWRRRAVSDDPNPTCAKQARRQGKPQHSPIQ